MTLYEFFHEFNLSLDELVAKSDKNMAKLRNMFPQEEVERLKNLSYDERIAEHDKNNINYYQTSIIITIDRLCLLKICCSYFTNFLKKK